MNWLDVIAAFLFALGIFAGGVWYFYRVKTNPLILIGLVFGWLQTAWPTIKTIAIRVALYLLASSPETQARAREDSRQRNEPGRRHDPK